MFEEEEEDSGMSAVRYACMPSLVSLQLMRNRLHLAYLGRKLMKWSALATGRELRKIAMQLDLVYDSFAEDMRNAYMLLARGRYFCPIMNKMVIENVAEKASVTAKSTLRMVTGVKIPQYEIVESGVEPYEHLGIEKGGQQIHEAKVAWLELLKRLVLIVQLRVSFTLVELANKSATKRSKVINKIMIPRTTMTIHYIILELEEKAREEMFRMKMIKKNKLKTQAQPVCPVCKLKIGPMEKEEIISTIPSKTATISKIDSCCINIDLGKTRSLMFLPKKETTIVLSNSTSTTDSIKKITLGLSQKGVTEEQNFLSTEQSIKLEEKIPNPKTVRDAKLVALKKLLAEIITVGKDVVQTGLSNMDVSKFLETCEDAKTRIDSFILVDKKSEVNVDNNLNERLNQLKTHLKKVIEITPELNNTTNLTENLDCLATCSKNNNSLNNIKKNMTHQFILEGSQVCQGNHEKNIMDITKTPCKMHIKNETVSKSSVVRCSSYKSDNFKLYNNEKNNVTSDCKPLGSINDIPETNKKLLEPKLKEYCLDKLTVYCKYIKDKLEACMNDFKAQSVSSHADQNNENRIKENKDYDRNFIKPENPISENVNDLIECCRNIKKLIVSNESDHTENNYKICTSIDKTIDLLQKLKKESLVSDNMTEGYGNYDKKLCERYVDTASSGSLLYEEYCSCDDSLPSSVGNMCTECNVLEQSVKSLPFTNIVERSCEFGERSRGTKQKDEVMDQSCSRVLEQETSEKRFQKVSTNLYNKIEKICESIDHLCNKDFIGPDVSHFKKTEKQRVFEEHSIKNNQTNEPEKDTMISPPSNKSLLIRSSHEHIKLQHLPKKQTESILEMLPESSIGLFEKRLKRIVRVTRTLNKDGTIREETETITIKKSRHDPTATTFTDEEENDIGVVSSNGFNNDKANNHNTHVD